MHENIFELYPMTLTAGHYNDGKERTFLQVAKQEVCILLHVQSSVLNKIITGKFVTI